MAKPSTPFKPTVKRPKHHFWLILMIVAVLSGLASYAAGLKWPQAIFETSQNFFPKPEPKTVGGQIIEFKHSGSLLPSQIDSEAKVVYTTGEVPAAGYAIEKYDVVYTSQDPRDGKQTKITARFYLPVGGKKLPVFGFGPGTTGPGPSCAPTLEKSRGRNWALYDNHLAFYAGQGYAVAVTDYDGRLEPGGIHHYFVGEPEGRAMLDMVRAIRKFKDPERFKTSPVGTHVFLGGYSQGGHASLWADQIRLAYAPDVEIAGIVGFVPATDVTKMFADTAKGSASSWIPPWVYASYDDYYGLQTPATTFFKEPFATNIHLDARNICIDQAGGIQPGHYGMFVDIDKLYQPELLAALRNGTFNVSYPEIASLLVQNRAGDKPTDTPILVIGGNRDLVIPVGAQTELAKRVCAYAGANLQMNLAPQVSHYTAMSSGRGQVLGWMAQITSGGKPLSDCAKYR